LRKDYRKVVKDVLSLVAVLLLLYAFFNWGLPALLGTKQPFMSVASNSMVPTYRRGDLLIIQGVDPSEISVGDVIVFVSPQTGRYTVHRVIEAKTGLGGERIFRTKGDANVAPDPFFVREEDIIGRPVASIPVLGGVLEFFQRGEGRTIIILLIVVLSAADIVSAISEEALKKESEETSEGEVEEAPGEEIG